MIKKLLTFMGVGLLSVGLSFSLSGCKEENKEYTIPEDTYDMDLTASDILEKLLDTALGGLKFGGKAILGSALDFATQSIGEALGFAHMDDLKYREEVMERFDKLDSAILKLDNKLDILGLASQDKMYRERYFAFVDQYKKSSAKVLSIYQQYNDLISAIEDKQNPDIEKTLNSIYSSIQGTSVGVADLDDYITPLGYYFVSNDNNLDKLEPHSIFSIAEYYARGVSPYSETIHEALVSILTEPLHLYWVGNFLLNLNYSRILKENGVTKIYIGTDGYTYAYLTEDGYYLNATSSEKDKKIEAYKEEFKQAIADEKAKALKDGIEYKEPAPLADMKVRKLVSLSSDANFAAINLGTITKNYNKVASTCEKLLDTYKIEPENKTVKTITYDGVTYKHKLSIDTVTIANLIESGEGENSILNYDKWGNISDKEFKALAKNLLHSSRKISDSGEAKMLTFREVLAANGFTFPNNNSADYLILGVKMGKKGSYAQQVHVGASIDVYCVKLDRTVDDFLKTEKYDIVSYQTTTVTGSCTTDYEKTEYSAEGVVNVRDDNLNLKCWKDQKIKNFYTIWGLTNSPKTGTKKGIEMEF